MQSRIRPRSWKPEAGFSTLLFRYARITRAICVREISSRSNNNTGIKVTNSAAADWISKSGMKIPHSKSSASSAGKGTGSWRKLMGKGVPHPRSWGVEPVSPTGADEASEEHKCYDVFNPKTAKGLLSWPSKSPWVWSLRDLRDDAYHPVAQDVRERNWTLQPHYFPPHSLAYELPKQRRPEVAFAGRSNVGKSTLVGALLDSPTLVKASKEPGCTRNVNFFGMLYPKRHKIEGTPLQTEQDRVALYLVDLPGYGFARAVHADVENWVEVVKNYLAGRDTLVLRRTFVLIDGRQGIMKRDIETMKVFDKKAVAYQIVITKADLLRESEIAKVVENVMKVIVHHGAAFPAIHVVSAKSGAGMLELQDAIYRMTDMAHSRQDDMEADI